MSRFRVLLAGFVAVAAAACAMPSSESEEASADGPDGKDDRGTSQRFTEIDPAHTNATFRTYIHRALDKLHADPSELAQLTEASIRAGRVRIDELSDLTCADFLRVANDLPDLHLAPSDHAMLQQRGSAVASAIANELDGYMWSNRIYVSRGQSAQRLAATLVHEVNHVINRSEIGYYDDLPTSAFIHEYRAFHAESLFDPAEYDGIDLVDYVITAYDLDRSKIHADVLAHPLTPKLLPTETAWRARRVSADPVDTATCD